MVEKMSRGQANEQVVTNLYTGQGAMVRQLQKGLESAKKMKEAMDDDEGKKK